MHESREIVGHAGSGRSSESRALPRMNGHAHLSFAVKDGMTRLATLDQASPLRVLFPRNESSEPPVAAITVISGGIVGGDSLDISVVVPAGGQAVATGQAAEKIYRSTGPDSRIDVDLKVGADGWLEWLPQETIMFDGARLRRRTNVEVDPAGRLLAGEMIVFGRLARGETVRHGQLSDRWEVRQNERLVWADALSLEGDIQARLDSPAGFDGARASAMSLYVAPDSADFLETARELNSDNDGVRAGASLVNGVLVSRWLGKDPLAVRRSFVRYLSAMRNAAGGFRAGLPRLWHV